MQVSSDLMKIVKKVEIGKSRQVGDDQISVGGSVSREIVLYKPNSIRNQVRTSQPQALFGEYTNLILLETK